MNTNDLSGSQQSDLRQSDGFVAVWNAGACIILIDGPATPSSAVGQEEGSLVTADGIGANKDKGETEDRV